MRTSPFQAAIVEASRAFKAQDRAAFMAAVETAQREAKDNLDLIALLNQALGSFPENQALSCLAVIAARASESNRF